MNGRYLVVLIDDDSSMRAMWNIASQISAPAMEIYVKQVKKVNSVWSTSQSMLSQPGLSTGQCGPSFGQFGSFTFQCLLI